MRNENKIKILTFRFFIASPDNAFIYFFSADTIWLIPCNLIVRPVYIQRHGMKFDLCGSAKCPTAVAKRATSLSLSCTLFSFKGYNPAIMLRKHTIGKTFRTLINTTGVRRYYFLSFYVTPTDRGDDDTEQLSLPKKARQKILRGFLRYEGFISIFSFPRVIGIHSSRFVFLRLMEIRSVWFSYIDGSFFYNIRDHLR